MVNVTIILYSSDSCQESCVSPIIVFVIIVLIGVGAGIIIAAVMYIKIW